METPYICTYCQNGKTFCWSSKQCHAHSFLFHKRTFYFYFFVTLWLAQCFQCKSYKYYFSCNCNKKETKYAQVCQTKFRKMSKITNAMRHTAQNRFPSQNNYIYTNTTTQKRFFVFLFEWKKNTNTQAAIVCFRKFNGILFSINKILKYLMNKNNKKARWMLLKNE